MSSKVYYPPGQRPTLGLVAFGDGAHRWPLARRVRLGLRLICVPTANEIFQHIAKFYNYNGVYSYGRRSPGLQSLALNYTFERTSLTFWHWAGVSPHTLSYDFAETCVFGKQSLGSSHCGKDGKTNQTPLLPKLRGHFAEFLRESSLAPLSIFYQPTCVGLRYRLYKMKSRTSFSWKFEMFFIPFQGVFGAIATRPSLLRSSPPRPSGLI